MKRSTIAVLVGVGAVVFGLLFSVISWYDTGVDLNNGTVAQYRDNQNSYDAMWKKIVEVAQVPAKYKEDFKDLLVGEVKAKFGDGGSKAMMQWFKERDIRPDASMYTKVQTVIEAGRNDFQRNQQDLLNKQRRASTHNGTAFAKFAGMFANPFPEIHGDLKPPKDIDGNGLYNIFDYDIVTSGKTKRAFETGEDAPVNVFGENK
tara:strand:- start:4865 stop:5476 length:612 start_codon:yes stop_codon:yes gene_type:complete